MVVLKFSALEISNGHVYPQKSNFFPFYLEGVTSNGKKRGTFFEGNSSASDLPTVAA